MRRNTCVPGFAIPTAALARTHEGRRCSTHLPKARGPKRTHNGLNSANAIFRCRLRRVFVLPSAGRVLQERLHNERTEKLCCYAKRSSDRCLQRRECCERFAEHSGSIKPRRPFQSGTGQVASTNLAPTGVIWNLFRKRLHPQSPDRGRLPVSPSAALNRGPASTDTASNSAKPTLQHSPKKTAYILFCCNTLASHPIQFERRTA